MSRLRSELNRALAALEIALNEERESEIALSAAHARIEDLKELAGKQASALVAKDQEIIFLQNQLRDFVKWGPTCGP